MTDFDMDRLKGDIKTALDRKELSLHYQPIIDLADGSVEGFEALMRWTHAELGNIPPGIFIPLAEETGVIIEASQWALKEACDTLKRLEDRIGIDKTTYMSINFSSRDFAQEGFTDALYNILSQYDLNPGQIHLEITEHLINDQPDSALETLKMCQAVHIGITLDDFDSKTDLSGLLSTYPISAFKLNQKLVREAATDQSASTLIQSYILLAQKHQIEVIAQGIETMDHATAFKAMGGKKAQGYYFSKPLAERELTDTVDQWTPVKIAS